MSASFEDGKADDALRTIGEVGEALGLKSHVLRYWEEQFPQLNPLKRSGGRRYYRPADVALVREIDRLVNRQGYTLRGAKAALKDFDPAADPARTTEQSSAQRGDLAEQAIGSANGKGSGDRHAHIARLRSIRQSLAAALDA